jgi:hypothetical protein
LPSISPILGYVAPEVFGYGSTVVGTAGPQGSLAALDRIHLFVLSIVPSFVEICI